MGGYGGCMRVPLLLCTVLAFPAGAAPIDREALVKRHTVVVTKPDKLSPLTVGNGEFAFTADVTGLQTFPEFYEQKGGIPLGTQAQWGWHASPNPEKFTRDEVFLDYRSHGRTVPYLDARGESEPNARLRAAANWLRANPHRIDLGRIRLNFGREIRIEELHDIRQTLDLWTGVLTSEFVVDGEKVRVTTTCHPQQDVLGVRVESKLLLDGRLWVDILFPSAAEGWRQSADWNAKPEHHSTEVRETPNGLEISRRQDTSAYRVMVHYPRGSKVRWEPGFFRPHHIVLSRTSPLSFAVEFLRDSAPSRFERSFEPGDLPVDPSAHWRKFWTEGGCLDLSGSRDPRWRELERRIVLSQYLTAVNCAGSTPPQETGLTFNSWFGKFHLEMHWWHAAHFALWNRESLLERSLGYYDRILPVARATATKQGYAGARWPKMTDPEGAESPSNIGVFLVWQQPHPIYYAELLYRARPEKATLERHRDMVFATAEFMASYAAKGPDGKFALGPPLIPAQEDYSAERATLTNPTFELAYWQWALKTAQKWRERLGQPREPKWDEVADGLAAPHIRDGIYTAIDQEPFTRHSDHPSMLMAFGFVPPTPLIDRAIMGRTLDEVRTKWDWDSTWGWDYPVVAMTAARLGRPAQALDALLMDVPKNRYLPNGHNWQSDRLPIYLPGNGGLLYAAAMMAAGWDGAPAKPAPGFPDDGSWTVRQEGLRAAP